MRRCAPISLWLCCLLPLISLSFIFATMRNPIVRSRESSNLSFFCCCFSFISLYVVIGIILPIIALCTKELQQKHVKKRAIFMCNILTHTHFWLYPVKTNTKTQLRVEKKENNELNTDGAEKIIIKSSPNKLEPQQRRCKIKYHIYARPVCCYYYRILTKMPQITHAKRNEFNQFHHDYFTQNVQTASLTLSYRNWKRTDIHTHGHWVELERVHYQSHCMRFLIRAFWATTATMQEIKRKIFISPTSNKRRNFESFWISLSLSRLCVWFSGILAQKWIELHVHGILCRHT